MFIFLPQKSLDLIPFMEEWRMEITVAVVAMAMCNIGGGDVDEG